MSDDEEVLLVKKQKVLHYGSLEENERLKLSETNKDEDDDHHEAVKTGVKAGNINISEGNRIYMCFSVWLSLIRSYIEARCKLLQQLMEISGGPCLKMKHNPKPFMLW